ncbi:MAG: TetR/AcrR family transcriptional regulator [Candidatus Omnitrophica bacterium]|nr:TetR/AcrR family transcriptional regulator [Candidatus Omnitrophota bacterium]
MRTALADSPTRKRLLDAAEKLMLSQGFAATSVEEICDAAKLTKGSFFHYFESKDELGKAVLERYCADRRKGQETLLGTNPDPLSRIYTYLDTMAKSATDPSMSKGCLLGMFSQELCELNPEIQACCEQGFAGWTKRFAQELAAAKAKHAPRKDFRPQELAEHLIAVVQGSLILGKAQKDMRILAKGLRHYKAYVRSVFGK